MIGQRSSRNPGSEEPLLLLDWIQGAGLKDVWWCRYQSVRRGRATRGQSHMECEGMFSFSPLKNLSGMHHHSSWHCLSQKAFFWELLEKRCPGKSPAVTSVLLVRSQSSCDDSVSAQMQCDGRDSLQMIYGCLLLEPLPGVSQVWICSCSLASGKAGFSLLL